MPVGEVDLRVGKLAFRRAVLAHTMVMLDAEQKPVVDPGRKSLERPYFLTTGWTTDNKTAALICLLVVYYQVFTEI